MKKLLLIAGLLVLNPAQSSESILFRSLLLSRAVFAGYYVYHFSDIAKRRAKYYRTECIEFDKKLKSLEWLAPLFDKKLKNLEEIPPLNDLTRKIIYGGFY